MIGSVTLGWDSVVRIKKKLESDRERTYLILRLDARRDSGHVLPPTVIEGN